MKDEDIKRLSEDELVEHIDSLECQPWLEELRGLRPQVAGQNLYALGFAAGQQSIAQTNVVRVPGARWSAWSTACVSSVLSIAATALMMWQLSPMLVRSSSQRGSAEQSSINSGHVIDRPTSRSSATDEAPRGRIDSASPNLDEVLARRMRSASGAKILGGLSELENGSGQIERERVRYVNQRDRWLSELSESTQLPQ